MERRTPANRIDDADAARVDRPSLLLLRLILSRETFDSRSFHPFENFSLTRILISRGDTHTNRWTCAGPRARASQMARLETVSVLSDIDVHKRVLVS
jgi:hypothetical protein